MIRTKLIRDTDGQIVRLPADVAFPPEVDSVVVVSDGPQRIVLVEETGWDDFFDRPGIAIERGPQAGS